MLQRLIVTLVVVVALMQALRSLLPLRARVAVARWLQPRLPDRVIVWFAGQSACEACGGRVKPPSGQRTE
ncbi:MAG: hypothetical protein WCP04_00710 [Pseudomonadota bacterium]|jgi:hypothetical protein